MIRKRIYCPFRKALIIKKFDINLNHQKKYRYFCLIFELNLIHIFLSQFLNIVFYFLINDWLNLFLRNKFKNTF